MPAYGSIVTVALCLIANCAAMKSDKNDKKQWQPPKIYKIDKMDFRRVVQQLTSREAMKENEQLKRAPKFRQNIRGPRSPSSTYTTDGQNSAGHTMQNAQIERKAKNDNMITNSGLETDFVIDHSDKIRNSYQHQGYPDKNVNYIHPKEWQNVQEISGDGSVLERSSIDSSSPMALEKPLNWGEHQIADTDLTNHPIATEGTVWNSNGSLIAYGSPKDVQPIAQPYPSEAQITQEIDDGMARIYREMPSFLDDQSKLLINNDQMSMDEYSRSGVGTEEGINWAEFAPSPSENDFGLLNSSDFNCDQSFSDSPEAWDRMMAQLYGEQNPGDTKGELVIRESRAKEEKELMPNKRKYQANESGERKRNQKNENYRKRQNSKGKWTSGN